MDWRQQEFDVGCVNHRSIAMNGAQLCNLTIQESKLPPHDQQPKRAYEYLPTMPWLVRARRTAPAVVDVTAADEDLETTVYTARGATRNGRVNQLPFGIFIREVVRAPLRDLPPAMKSRPVIQEILTADPPCNGSKVNWTPENSAMIKRHADALRRIGVEVRVLRTTSMSVYSPATTCAVVALQR